MNVNITRDIVVITPLVDAAFWKLRDYSACPCFQLQHCIMTAMMMINSTTGIAGAAHSEVSLSIATPIAPMLAIRSC